MLTETKKVMGRPSFPKGTAKGVLCAVRVSEQEAIKIDNAVAQSGLKKPEWIRNALISAANKATV